MKTGIIAQLGHADILLPSLIAEGLAANGRVKARLTALQAAAQHAGTPSAKPIDLATECRAAGIDAAAIKSLVSEARQAGNGRIAAPGFADVGHAIRDDVEIMIRAVAAGSPGDARAARDRLSAIEAQELFAATDEADADRIARLTGIFAGGGDSLHRLVMDLHKGLNRLAAGCAEEILAGARVHGLLPEDRTVVQAFMRGVDSTRALKFNHPGLDATAARCGSRLLVQNDIGTTDAHVVVIAVEENTVTITYTDVHLARARFFTELLDRFPVNWSGLDRHDKGGFYLVTGCYRADSEQDRDAFMESLGASLVFLIDWNKARKVLRAWVSRSDSVRVLDWAARNRIGHRAFLELGGGELVAAAIRHAAPARIGFGERLETALGREAAVDFLKTVLRVSTEGLLEGRSVRLVRDRIEAEVVRHLERVDSELLSTVIRQAGLAREIASAIHAHIAGRQSGRPVDAGGLAARARRIEEKADKIAIDIRNEIARLDASPTIEQMANQVEQAIDELEQAAFIASRLPARLDPSVLAAPARLCAVATAGAEAAASGIAAAADVPDGHQVDAEDALASVARLIDIEHEADTCERAVTTLVLGGDLDPTICLSLLELARATERATDRLAGMGHLLRRYVLADLSA
jgi:uncharacterized protein Yka (UPF0111/DUF47 family)